MMNSGRTILVTTTLLATIGRHCQCFTLAPLAPPTATSVSSPSVPYLTRLSVAQDSTVVEGLTNGDSDGLNAAAASSVREYFGEVAEVFEFELKEHKPLGCTAEESLAEEVDGAKHVFVSKVAVDGNCGTAGIQVGDVIVGISGSFDDVVSVAGLGLDRIRSLVAVHPEEESLVIRIVRGTDVQERHETMIVDICTFNEGVDSQIEECIVNLNTYDYGFDEGEPTVECDNDEETECMLDQMFGEWGEEMPGMSPEELAQKEAEKENEEAPKEPKIAPWSSRSSPSGTFVRDPATGEMRNIDSQ